MLTPREHDPADARRLRDALEAMVEAHAGPTFNAIRCHDANALAVRTLAELFPEAWHNRIPAERRANR